MVEEKREKKKKKKLSKEKEEAGNFSKQCDKGWIHIIHVHNTTQLAVTTTLWSQQQMLTNYPTQRKTERSR